MPSNLFGFLDPYIRSAGQPTYGGSDMDRELPGDFYMPEIRTTPVDEAGMESGAAPMSPPPQRAYEAEQIPSRGGWKQGLKDNLGGILGAVGTGLAAKFTGGSPLAALAGFTQGYSNEKLRMRQQREQQEFETSKAMDDRLHKMWQELSAADLSKLPPNLSHLAQSKSDFDKKYTAALLDDSPGGKRISPKERSEMLALGAVLQSAIPEVERFKEASVKAEPYTAAIRGGNFEPPPGAEQIAEMGLPDDESTNLAGIEAMRGAELTRAQYDTPVFDERLKRLISPREAVTLAGQEAMARRASDSLAATENNRNRLDADRDRAFKAQQDHWNRMDQRRADEDAAREARYNRMPVQVQTTDEDGNPVTRFVTRESLLQTGGAEFNKPLPGSERTKVKEAESALANLKNLQQMYKPEFVGPIGARAYALGEQVPEFAQGVLPEQMQNDPLRSAFRAQAAGAQNWYVKLITGAQVGQTEEAGRILRVMPKETDNPVVFKAKMDLAVTNGEVLYAIQAGKLSPEAGLAQIRANLDAFGKTSKVGTGGGLQPPPGGPAPARKYKIISVE